MVAILAEDDSDAEALSNIVRQILTGVRIKPKGYDGGGGLCRKGARDIKTWWTLGFRTFVVCHDADKNSPESIRDKLLKEVVVPAEAAGNCCIAVPVQEIEAWLIADEMAIKKVIPKFDFKGHSQPEKLDDPKEWLIEQSEAENGKPLYSPKTFNPAVAKQLRIDVVQKKCPSFALFISHFKTVHASAGR